MCIIKREQLQVGLQKTRARILFQPYKLGTYIHFPENMRRGGNVTFAGIRINVRYVVPSKKLEKPCNKWNIIL